MAVKLTDIAGKAGVSIATVSRVIRKGHVDNSPSCQKVLKIVKEMGYEPNRIRKPKGMGNILFAMMGIPQESNSEYPTYSISNFYGLFLYSAEKEIRKLQSTLTVCNIEEDVADIPAWIRQTLRDSSCRGVILMGGKLEHKHIDIFRERCPVVVLNGVQGGADVDTVSPDDEGGIRMEVRQLVQLGHRRIAFWADRDANGRIVDHTVLRVRGYQSGMEEARLTYNRIYSEEIGEDLPFVERMERGFQAFLNDPERPTAILCTGDSFAYHVLRLAQKYGIDVPGELSIFGFDDSEMSVHTHPQLSTVNIQRAWMSREAVRLLMRRIAEPEYPPSLVTVQAKVIERETSGPAPK